MEHPLISTAMFVLVLLAIWCVLPACASVSTVQKMTGAPSQVTMVTQKLSSAGQHPFVLIFPSRQLLWSEYIICTQIMHVCKMST